MSNILTFEVKQQSYRSGATRTAAAGPAEVVIFPGVRYERCAESNGANPDAPTKRQKKSASRKR